MRLTKTLGLAGALILSALVGGTLIGSALATDDPTGTDADTTTTYCETFRDTLLSELGVTADELTAAGKTAANAAIDAAVAAGDLDEDRAADLKARVEAYDGSGCGWFGRGFAFGFGRGFERGMEHGTAGADVIESAAAAFDLDVAELRDALADVESLEALAADRGVDWATVKSAILADVQAGLDTAVADGLDQDRADAMLERVTTWLDEGGELGGMRLGPGFGPGFGPGMGHGHGPGGMWGHSDDTDESGT